MVDNQLQKSSFGHNFGGEQLQPLPILFVKRHMGQIRNSVSRINGQWLVENILREMEDFVAPDRDIFCEFEITHHILRKSDFSPHQKV
jgi:hypothetical protein